MGERYHRIGVTEKQSWIWKRASGAEENVDEGGIDGRAFRSGFLIPTAANMFSIFAVVLYRFIDSCQLTHCLKVM